MVFDKLLHGKLLGDLSLLQTCIEGKSMTVEKAIKRGNSGVPVGYILPKTKEIKFFTVRYNAVTDSVSVCMPE